MLTVKNIIFRNLTDADFFNINKPRGSEHGGGGQAYIDFPVRAISVENWVSFFKGIKNINTAHATQGPSWEFPVFSIGLPQPKSPQRIKIYQRRAASISITSQKIESTKSNRVYSWHPANGFPRPIDNTVRNQCPAGLMVYLVSTFEGEVWAGWYLNDGMSPSPIQGAIKNTAFIDMISPGSLIEGYSHMLTFKSGDVSLDINNKTTPFVLSGKAEPTEKDGVKEIKKISEEEGAEILFEDDFLSDGVKEPEVVKQFVNIRKRNAKISQKLKILYKHKCQITGDAFVFAKKNGENYTEAHHLIPLGAGGSDSAQNLVVLSPLIHKMLHHADVAPIDLSKIKHSSDGSAELEILINNKPYKIQWHPKHAELFR